MIYVNRCHPYCKVSIDLWGEFCNRDEITEQTVAFYMGWA